MEILRKSERQQLKLRSQSIKSLDPHNIYWKHEEQRNAKTYHGNVISASQSVGSHTKQNTQCLQ